jgi:predicted NBD/HSP70 family sugar kinase
MLRAARRSLTRAMLLARHGAGAHATQALSEAVAKLVNQCEWTGNIGIGMPGRVQVRPPSCACAASTCA